MAYLEEIEQLRCGLDEALCRLHHRPELIVHDEELETILLSLYGSTPPGRVWSEVIVPYLFEHESGLRNVWDEHASSPKFSLLNYPESLLAFERAEHQRELLRRSWPLSSSCLAQISDVWGVPL